MKDKSTQYDGVSFTYNQHFPTSAVSTTSSSQAETNVLLPIMNNHMPKQMEKDEDHANANVVRIRLGSRENDISSNNGLSVQKEVKSSLSNVSSSIPSSYEKHPNTNITTISMSVDDKKGVQLSQLVGCSHENLLDSKKMSDDPLPHDDLPPLRKPFTIPMLPSSSPSHNRGRRGGIVPKESDAVVHAASALNKPRHPVLTIPPPPPIDLTTYSTNESILENLYPSGILINDQTLNELELKSRALTNDYSINAQLQSMPDSIIRVSISNPSS